MNNTKRAAPNNAAGRTAARVWRVAHLWDKTIISLVLAFQHFTC